MARSYNGTTQVHSRTSAVVSGVPCTIAGWFRPGNITTNYSLFGMGHPTAGLGGMWVQFLGAVANDPIRAVYQSDGGTNGLATVNTSVSANQWNHAASVFSAVNSRVAYINGTAGSVNTDAVTAPTLGRTAIAAVRMAAAFNGFFAGQIAEVGFWNVALSTAQIQQLADGYSPMAVRPDALVSYYPLHGRQDDEEDWTGGLTMTATAAPTSFDHPRVIYVRPRHYGTRFVPPQSRKLHQYRMRRSA